MEFRPGKQSRSTPQQARSRDKHDRILAATAAVLAELPYDQVGTKLIAERAGVSVGTLYRFFPDRDSIAQALLLGWLEEFTAVLERVAATAPEGEPGVFLDQFVDAYAGFFRGQPGFRNIFFHAPRTPDLEQAQRGNDDDAAGRMRAVLASRYGVADDDLGTRCLIAVEVADLLVGRAFRDQTDGNRKVLDETKRMLRAYLIG